MYQVSPTLHAFCVKCRNTYRLSCGSIGVIYVDFIYLFFFIIFHFPLSCAVDRDAGWVGESLRNTWLYRFLCRCVSMQNGMEYNGCAKRHFKLIVFPLSTHSDLLLFISLFISTATLAKTMTEPYVALPPLFNHRRDANVAYSEIDELHQKSFQLKSAATTAVATATVLAHIDDVVLRCRCARTKWK